MSVLMTRADTSRERYTQHCLGLSHRSHYMLGRLKAGRRAYILHIIYTKDMNTRQEMDTTLPRFLSKLDLVYYCWLDKPPLISLPILTT